MTELRPGTSPPPVRIPIRLVGIETSIVPACPPSTVTIAPGVVRRAFEPAACFQQAFLSVKNRSRPESGCRLIARPTSANDYIAGARAITAIAVAEAEIHWSWSNGNALWKYG